MEDLGSILVILDKPGHRQLSLERARALAGISGAHLHLASFCWLPMVTRSDIFDTHQRRAIRKSATIERRRWLDGLVLDEGLSADDIDTEVVWTEDIAGWVASHGSDYDLVVKSIHKSGSLWHTPLDWALLRHAPMPVLLVPDRARKSSGRVLVTVDLHSPDARHRRLNEAVIEAAARMAQLMKGKLHCVNVVEVDGSFEDLEFFDARKMQKKARDDAAEALKAILSGYDVSRNRIHLPVGKVGKAVAALAEDIDADLVVVGTGARRGLGAKLLGGSAEKILTRSTCDVLAVHV